MRVLKAALTERVRAAADVPPDVTSETM